MDLSRKKLFFLALAILVFAVIALIPLSPTMASSGQMSRAQDGGIEPSDQQVSSPLLTRSGKLALAVLAFALVLWITETFPFHITGFLAIVLLALFNVGTFKEIVASGFGNDVVLFMVGVLILSAFVNQSGLGRRATLFLLSKIGNRTRLVVLGFLVVGALFSMWLSNMAMAAILMPLAKEILDEEGLRPLESNFGRALLIACAWGPSIGGIGTPAGAGPNPIAIGFLADLAGFQLSFPMWTFFGLPFCLALIVPAWLILMLLFPPEQPVLSRSREEIKSEYRNLAPLNRAEKATIVIFLLTVVFWLSSGLLERWFQIRIPISMTVILTSSLLFIPSVTGIRWRQIEEDVSWGSILLVLAGISMGITLHRTGAASWLSLKLLGGLADLHPILLIFLIILLVSLLKVVLSSNSVSATITVPIMIAFALRSNLPIIQTVLPAAITSSLSFILVTSAPTNVITYAAGYYTVWDMAKAGILLTIVASVLGALIIFGISTLNINL